MPVASKRRKLTGSSVVAKEDTSTGASAMHQEYTQQAIVQSAISKFGIRRRSSCNIRSILI
jgi:hypothetical protein